MESIRRLRQDLALTQGELAARLGVSRVTISRWENGQVRPSSLAANALDRLARVYGAARLSPTHRPRQAASPAAGPAGQSRTVSRQNSATAAPVSGSHQKLRALSRCPLFSDLDSGSLLELSRLARNHDLKAGEFLFFEGDPVESCHVVVSGMVKVMKHSTAGKDFVTATYGPGEMMGNLLLLLDRPYTASCQAATDAAVLAIGSEDFLSFLHRHPGPGFFVLEKMLRVAGKRHIDVTSRLSEFASQRADSRLAQVLFMLSSKFGPTIPLTRREIAEMAGTTTETAIRFVSNLQRMGVVRSFRGKVVVLCQDELESFSRAVGHP
ncbi:MAG: cyclic nucleotide-binding domain-containing protein [Chloroflexi bacterium]|nr:cyclic nucleotide-binding domain-containing protein [Chloroflexota bacterium]